MKSAILGALFGLVAWELTISYNNARADLLKEKADRIQRTYRISDAEHAINVSRVAEFDVQLKDMGIPLD